MSENEHDDNIDCPECGKEMELAIVGEHPTYAGGTAQIQTEWMSFCNTEGCSRRARCLECGSGLNLGEVGTSSGAGDHTQQIVSCSNPDCPTNDSDLAPAATQP